MIRTLNLNRETTAILENAYAIGYEKQVNAIWQASFSLPLNDPKVSKVELLKYVEITDNDDYIGLFRIIPKRTVKDESTQEVRFQCEHVLATLLGTPLFKYHQLTNYTTKDVLQYLIDRQFHKHWRLGTVEFTRYFHYSWENENLLSAIFSVPKTFDEPYIWTWDTQSYPWTLNLVKPKMVAVSRIKEGYNLIGFEVEEDPRSVFNRIYPLGAGEGVNQLTIESVNNGVPYIEDRQPGEEIIATVWPDNRFIHADHLKASAAALLKKWKEPIVTWKVSAVDVSKITGLSIDKFKSGKVVRLQLDDFPTMDLRIMKEAKPDMKGDPGNIPLDIGNVQEDLSTTETDLQRRQQINELYSQGATNILNFTYQDNADNVIPANIPFYIDDDVVNVNTVELTFRTKRMRTYGETTTTDGEIIHTETTGAGGGTVKASTTGGGGEIVKASTTSNSGQVVQSTTTQGGGGSSQTSSATGTHRHRVFGYSGTYGSIPPADNWQQFSAPRSSDGSNAGVIFLAGAAGDVYTQSADGLHSHAYETPTHTHGLSINIPGHTHPFEIQLPNHVHPFEFTLEHHTHPLEFHIPGHKHKMEHKIIELDELPSKVTIKVDGNIVPHTNTSGDRINLVDYMSKDTNGKVNRGRHEVEILPDERARIEADLILRVFIQSQLGGNF